MVRYIRLAKRATPRRMGRRPLLTKRLFKRRTRNNRQKNSISLGVGMPRKLTMTHKYVDTFNMTSTVGQFATYQFSTNNIFHPDTNDVGVSHQPMLHDQLAALYNNYVVIGSKCTISVIPQATNEEGFRIVGYIEDDTTVTPTNVTTLLEQSKSRLIYMPPNANNTKYMTLKWSARKAFGRGILSNNDIDASAGASPTKEHYFTLGIRGTGVQTTIAEVTIKLEYVTVWREPKRLGAS